MGRTVGNNSSRRNVKDEIYDMKNYLIILLIFLTILISGCIYPVSETKYNEFKFFNFVFEYPDWSRVEPIGKELLSLQGLLQEPCIMILDRKGDSSPKSVLDVFKKFYLGTPGPINVTDFEAEMEILMGDVKVNMKAVACDYNIFSIMFSCAKDDPVAEEIVRHVFDSVDCKGRVFVGECRFDSPEDICESIFTEMPKRTCFGVIKQNIAECDNLVLSFDKDFCQYHVASAIADKTNDSSKCELAPEGFPRDKCYLNYALEKSDSLVCHNISDPYDTNHCLRELLKDPAICERYAETRDQMVCYSILAQETKNTSLCRNTENEIACLREIGKLTNNVSLCFGYDSCYLEIAKSTNNVSICAKIEYVPYRNECYTEIASSLKDATLCTNVHEDVRNICLGMAYKDEAYCPEDPFSIDAKRCWDEVAVFKGSASLCANFECYLEIGKKYPQACRELKGFVDSNKCLSKAGIYHTNTSFCCNINIAEERDECFLNAATGISDTGSL